jgi:hypothetical protein
MSSSPLGNDNSTPRAVWLGGCEGGDELEVVTCQPQGPPLHRRTGCDSRGAVVALALFRPVNRDREVLHRGSGDYGVLRAEQLVKDRA